MKCLAFPLAGLETGFEPSGWDLGLRAQRDGRKGSHWMMGFGGVSSVTGQASVWDLFPGNKKDLPLRHELVSLGIALGIL